MSPLVNTTVVDWNSNYNSFQKQYCIEKLKISIVHKKLCIAILQKKFVNNDSV